MKAPAKFARTWGQNHGTPGDQACCGASRSEPGGRAQRGTAATPAIILQPKPDHRLSQQVDQ